MNRQKAFSSIQELLARFSAEVTIANAGNMYDINIHSENVIIPLLNKAYGLSLENANKRQKNYPAVDLIDETNRVAFQITASSDSEKVKQTLKKFVEHGLNLQFDVLYVFILTEKQKKYTGQGYAEITQGKFSFDKDRHIIDFGSLFNQIASIHEVERIEQIKALLETEFSEAKVQERKLLFQEASMPLEKTEQIFPNLLEITFPANLYIAELLFERKEIIEQSKVSRKKLKWSSDQRLVASWALNKLSGTYCHDWHLFEKKLITFRNLFSENEPLRKIVDKGTIEPLSSKDFFETSEDYNNTFKALLGFCLREKLSAKEVEWVHEEEVFRFKANQGVPLEKAVRWKKENSSKKTVIKEIWNKEKKHIVCFGHLAFKYAIFQFGEKWYLSISPTWSFTSNGWKRSGFSKEYTAGIKRLENNKSVYYYFRFWAYFLNYHDMFDPPYDYLQTKSPFSFEFSPVVDDAKWKPEKSESEKNESDVSVLIDTEFSKNLFA